MNTVTGFVAGVLFGVALGVGATLAFSDHMMVQSYQAMYPFAQYSKAAIHSRYDPDASYIDFNDWRGKDTIIFVRDFKKLERVSDQLGKVLRPKGDSNER